VFDLKRLPMLLPKWAPDPVSLIQKLLLDMKLFIHVLIFLFIVLLS